MFRADLEQTTSHTFTIYIQVNVQVEREFRLVWNDENGDVEHYIDGFSPDMI